MLWTNGSCLRDTLTILGLGSPPTRESYLQGHWLRCLSVLACFTLGALDSVLDGAESAKRDEMQWPIYDGSLATARCLDQLPAYIQLEPQDSGPQHVVRGLGGPSTLIPICGDNLSTTCYRDWAQNYANSVLEAAGSSLLCCLFKCVCVCDVCYCKHAVAAVSALAAPRRARLRCVDRMIHSVYACNCMLDVHRPSAICSAPPRQARRRRHPRCCGQVCGRRAATRKVSPGCLQRIYL